MKASVLLSVGCCSSSTKSEDVIKKAHATSIQPVQWPSQDFESRGAHNIRLSISLSLFSFLNPQIQGG